MPKKVLAAYIYQIIQFDTKEEYLSWKDKLIGVYQIEDVTTSDNGSVTVHIKKGYNKSPMEIVKG